MELFHLLNRGVDKRDVFIDDKDKVRFIHDLFVFNDSNHIDPNYGKRFDSGKYLSDGRKRDLLVQIHSFCLMSNHYHLLVSELQEGGISKFMQKLNKGFSQYFNEKYDRVGALWQGKYKKIPISNNAHFLHIPYYIHLNPLDLTMPEWRLGEISNVKQAVSELENYRWSSHLDYAGKPNFASVIYKNFLNDKDMLGSPRQYLKELSRIISNEDITTSSTIIE